MMTHYLYMTFKKKISTIRPLIFTWLFLLLGSSAAYSSPPIDATFLSAQGQDIVMALSIKGPVPPNVIVDQYIHPANRIVATIPKARKFTPQRGEVKWLFRNVKSGRITITTKLTAPLKGPLKAVIRYRDPRSGRFIEFEIRP